MNAAVTEPRAAAFSVRVYRLMLQAYPREFRQEYGPHMLQVFEDYCLRAAQHGGAARLLRVWSITLLDFVRSLVEQHTHKETYMTHDKTIRGAGWALMLAGISLMLILISAEGAPNNWLLSSGFALMSSVLVAAGLLGLRAGFGEQAGPTGKNLLALGAAMALLPLLMFVPGLAASENGWIVIYASPALALAFLAAFGVVCARRGAIPQVARLAILAGAWFLPLMLFVTLLETARPYEYMSLRSLIQPLAWIASTIQSIALISLGNSLQRSTSPQPAAA